MRNFINHNINLFLKIIFLAAINFSCSYKNVYSNESVEVNFNTINQGHYFEKIIEEYSIKNKFYFQNKSKEYPSGKKLIFYKLSTLKNTSLTINDLADEKRFVIAIFESKEEDWKPIFENLINFIKLKFPDVKIKYLARQEKI